MILLCLQAVVTTMMAKKQKVPYSKVEKLIGAAITQAERIYQQVQSPAS